MTDILLYSDPSYETQITLDGKQYRLTFYYSDNESAWYLNIEGLTDTAIIVKGIKLVMGVDLLEPYALIDLGQLWLVDLTGQKRDPSFDNISNDFVLYYQEL